MIVRHLPGSASLAKGTNRRQGPPHMTPKSLQVKSAGSFNHGMLGAPRMGNLVCSDDHTREQREPTDTRGKGVSASTRWEEKGLECRGVLAQPWPPSTSRRETRR